MKDCLFCKIIFIFFLLTLAISSAFANNYPNNTTLDELDSNVTVPEKKWKLKLNYMVLSVAGDTSYYTLGAFKPDEHKVKYSYTALSTDFFWKPTKEDTPSEGSIFIGPWLGVDIGNGNIGSSANYLFSVLTVGAALTMDLKILHYNFGLGYSYTLGEVYGSKFKVSKYNPHGAALITGVSLYPFTLTSNTRLAALRYLGINYTYKFLPFAHEITEKSSGYSFTPYHYYSLGIIFKF